MATNLDYSILAGAAYYSTRTDFNRFPTPIGWVELIDDRRADAQTGFEARAFQRGSEIVISYAGTYSKSGADIQAGINLGLGLGSAQLYQAVEYYLQIKAVNPSAVITLTGHSLGGGLAALVGVFFGVSATVFDEAPFAQTALFQAQNLKAYLAGKLDGEGNRLYSDSLLAPLTSYIAQKEAFGASPTLIPNANLISNIAVQGEFLSGLPGHIATANESIANTSPGASDTNDLHSMALLSAFLQSRNTAAVGQRLNEVTVKLPDLVRMIFDVKLFGFASDDADNRSLIDHLVRHESGVRDPVSGATIIAADAMVTRFTKDLWKLAQDGGLTLTDGITGFPDFHELSKTLVAFAMQFYYENSANATNATKQLFSDVTGGVQFDMADVSKDFATATTNSTKPELAKVKGLDYAFKAYLAGSTFTTPERSLIQSMLPYLRDWYVQAGTGGLAYTDNLNRGAFMLGGTGSDALVGGSNADLLVGNAGDDVLQGRQGNDVLLGGKGHDTYIYQAGDGLDTILDRDGNGSILMDGQTLAGGAQYGDSRVYKSADGKHLYTFADNGTLLIDGQIVIQGFDRNRGDLALVFAAALPLSNPVTTRDIVGDRSPTLYGSAPFQYFEWDDIGNVVTGAAEPGRDDGFYGSPGNDHIFSDGGADVIQDSDGDDWIQSGSGYDDVKGGGGDDLIEGGADTDFLQGGSGNDRLFGNSQISVAGAIAVGNGLAGDGHERDVIGGGIGDDTLVGGVDDDFLYGGLGSDLLVAGPGNDNVYGDFDAAGDGLPHPGDPYFDWSNPRDLYSLPYFPLSFSYDPNIVGDFEVQRAAALARLEAGLHPVGYGADVVFAGSGIDYVWTGRGNDVIFGEDGTDFLSGDGDNDIIFGGDGADYLWGDGIEHLGCVEEIKGDDYLDGGAGADWLIGGAGSDILIGGIGDDQLWGGLGQDIYIFNVGDGVDSVFDSAAENNIMRFGVGFSAAAVKLRLGSLLLDMGNGDQVHIGNFDANNVYGSVAIASFEFADGTTLTSGELLEHGFDLDGTGQNDTIIGTNITDRINGFGSDDLMFGRGGNDVLEGGAGDDLLQGNGGNDVLSGGAGQDTLQGGDGSDVYVFNLGDGQDIVIDDFQINYEEYDTLQFGAGIAPESITFARNGNSLTLGIIGTTDQVTTMQWGGSDLGGGRKGLDRVTFVDGTVWDRAALETLSQNVPVVGTPGNDYLQGTNHIDIFDGGAGDDVLTGYQGNDVYLFNQGGGHDKIVDYDYSESDFDTLRFGAGILANDITFERDGLNLVMDVNGTADQVTIYNWSQRYYYQDHSAYRIEQVQFADGATWDLTYLQKRLDAVPYVGTAEDDSLVGNSGDNTLDGGAGNDLLTGSTGDDTYVFNLGGGQDTIYEFNASYDGYSSVDVLRFGPGILPADVVLSRAGSDLVFTIAATGDQVTVARWASFDGYRIERVVFDSGLEWDSAYLQAQIDPLPILGTAGDDSLGGGSGNTTMRGGLGDDTYVVVGPSQMVIENANEGTDTVVSMVSYTLGANVENLILDPYNSGPLGISGTGNALDNSITGNYANNVLDGGAGADYLYGDLGDDTYVVDNLGDVVFELQGAGVDTVLASIGFTLSAEVENLTLTGTAAINATGNELDNTLTGNSAANVLTAGAGNDIYVVGAGDTTIEASNAGTDTVLSAISWTLATNVENLTLTGNVAVNGTGNTLNNVLAGNSAANTLSGAAGDDQYTFGLGSGADRIIETTGTDRIVFGAGITAAQVTATRTGSVVKLVVSPTDNISIDQISSGVYAIEQFEFADGSVLGAAWVSSLIPTAPPTATNLNAAEAYTEDTAKNLVDIVVSDSDSATTTATLTLSNVAAGSLNTGTSGAVTSSYSAATGVWTASGVIANVNTLLAALTFTPTGNFNGNFSVATSVSDGASAPVTGNKTFTGVAVNDAPTATNLSAAETYTEDTALNLVDSVAADIDSANTTVTLTLSNVAAGSLNTGTSGAVSSTYNAGTGVWTASGATASVNTLLAALTFTPTANFNGNFSVATSVSDGVAAAVTGSKSFTGVAVNDAPTGTNLSAAETYTEDTALNLVDLVAADIDSANTTVTLTLSNVAAGSLNTGTSGAVTSTYNAGAGVWTASGATANVNTLLAALTFTPATNFNGNFTIATSASDGIAAPVTGSKVFTGAKVNDAPTGVVTITGTAAQNQTLTASNTVADVDGLGAISYQWSAAGVAIAGATGATLVLGSAQIGKAITVAASYTDGGATAESKTSAATAAVIASFLGTVGADTLSGTTAADQLSGLAGNDTYVVNNVGDVVVENLSEGVDLVNVSVSYTLAANVENITLAGATAINATGNGLDNVLTGNSAINVLTGGAGNDTYVVTSGDTTIEALNAGADTVQSAVAWTLAVNVENLTLTGTAAVNGTGNTDANVLTGNSGANTLSGNAGNDTLDGKAGADSLVGGAGNDTYWLGRGYGIDSITETDATAGNTDLAKFEAGVATNQLWFRQVANNLEVSIIGTSDKFNISNWYSGSANHVEQFKTSDGKTLLDSQVQNLVSAMAAFAPPAAGQTTLPANYATALAPVMAANWQ